jgi:hypothetical protein
MSKALVAGIIQRQATIRLLTSSQGFVSAHLVTFLHCTRVDGDKEVLPCCAKLIFCLHCGWRLFVCYILCYYFLIETTTFHKQLGLQIAIFKRLICHDAYCYQLTFTNLFWTVTSFTLINRLLRFHILSKDYPAKLPTT